MFLKIVCFLVKPTRSWFPNSPTSNGMSWEIKAKVASNPVSLPNKNAPPREIPSMRLWNTSPITNNHPWVLLSCGLSSSWWWWNELNPFSIKKNIITAPSVAFNTCVPSSAIPSGNKSLKPIINNTPAAKGVPYLTSFEDSFSLLNKINATDSDNNPAAALAKITTNKSDIIPFNIWESFSFLLRIVLIFIYVNI